MKKIAFFLFVVIIVFACGGKEESTANTKKSGAKATPTKTAAKIDGAKIYKQYCVTCHGLYGDMGASGAANLKESKLSLEERINVVTNGRNTMTPFKSLLNEEKIKAVAEYTMKLTKKEEK